MLVMKMVKYIRVFCRLLPLYFPRDKHEEVVAISKLRADVGDENGETVIDEQKIRIKPLPVLSSTTTNASTTSVDIPINDSDLTLRRWDLPIYLVPMDSGDGEVVTLDQVRIREVMTWCLGFRSTTISMQGYICGVETLGISRSMLLSIPQMRVWMKAHSSPGLYPAARPSLVEECAALGGCRAGMAK